MRLKWEQMKGDVEAYNVYGGYYEGGEQLLATVANRHQPSYTDSGLPPAVKRFYYVTAVNAAGESPPSDHVSTTTFLACAGHNCIGFHTLARLGALELVTPESSTPWVETDLRIEFGSVRIEAAGQYVEQSVYVPRSHGFPDPSVLNTLGVEFLTYERLGDIGKGFTVNPGPPGPGDPFVPTLWSGRFWVYGGPGGGKLTDVPFLVVLPGPRGDLLTPGPDLLAAAAALGLAAGLARVGAVRRRGP